MAASSSKELLRAQLKARATESPEERERRRKEREDDRARRRAAGGEGGDDLAPESGSPTPLPSIPDSPSSEEAKRRPRAATAPAPSDPEDARRKARGAAAGSAARSSSPPHNQQNDLAEAEELASLLDRAAVDANVLKAKLMHSKNLSYAEKTQVTKKLFDTILMEEGMLAPQPQLPSAAELAAQLGKEKEERALLEAKLQEATAYARTLESQVRDLRTQNETLVQQQQHDREKHDRHERHSHSSSSHTSSHSKHEKIPTLAVGITVPANISPRISPRSSVTLSASTSSTSVTPLAITSISSPTASTASSPNLTPQTPRRKTVVLQGTGATFGEPLADLLGAANDVPLFVSLATACLEMAAAGASDLFIRLSEKNQLADLRKAVQTGRYDLGSAEPHAVADLLIVFLEELPSPLVAPSIVPLLAEVSTIPEMALRGSALRSVLWSAPTTTRLVLLHYLLFFHRLASRKVTAKDLVRIAGPAILGLQRKKSDFSTLVSAGALAALEHVVVEGEKLLSWASAGVQLDKTEASLRVNAGTAEGLLALASNAFYGLADHDLVDVVIACHSYFTAPGPLLAVLKEGLRVKGNDAWQRRTRMFVLSALRKWLSMHRRVFVREKSLLKDAKSIVSHFKPEGDAEEEAYRALTALTASSGVTFEGSTSASQLLAKRKPISQKVDLLAHRPADLAAQLTLIDWAMLREISSEELLHKNYTMPEKSPNFAEMVDQFNRWSQLVPSEVLTKDSASARADVLAFFIHAAHKCVKNHNNFNSACAILAGLGHPSVTRLRNSWSKVPRKAVRRWRALQELFDMGFNFRAYRSAASAASSFLPYLGILPKDLLAIEENHPNRTEDGAVNLHKIRLIYIRGLATLEKAQAYDYGAITPHPLLFHFLAGLDRPDGHALMHDDDAHIVSHKFEPKK